MTEELKDTTAENIEKNEYRLPTPKIYLIRNGEDLYKPEMQTYIAGKDNKKENNKKQDTGYRGSGNQIVGGTVCTCNKVCSCNTQRSSGSSYSGSCSCNPVH